MKVTIEESTGAHGKILYLKTGGECPKTYELNFMVEEYLNLWLNYLESLVMLINQSFRVHSHNDIESLLMVKFTEDGHQISLDTISKAYIFYFASEVDADNWTNSHLETCKLIM
jgi:hypothetical protein